MDSYLSLIDELVKEGVLYTKEIIEAFRFVHRKFFLPDGIGQNAGVNAPLPLGYGQTISQPYTVAFMLELLCPEKGQKIMDIGYGSGWTSALLAHIVGDAGKVYAIEIVPELAEFGKTNIAKFGFLQKGIVQTFCQDGSQGLADYAPFDRIIAAASASDLPDAWLTQLASGGRLVAPVGQSIFLVEQKGPGRIEKTEFSGFLFVPLLRTK